MKHLPVKPLVLGGAIAMESYETPLPQAKASDDTLFDDITFALESIHSILGHKVALEDGAEKGQVVGFTERVKAFGERIVQLIKKMVDKIVEYFMKLVAHFKESQNREADKAFETAVKEVQEQRAALRKVQISNVLRDISLDVWIADHVKVIYSKYSAPITQLGQRVSKFPEASEFNERVKRAVTSAEEEFRRSEFRGKTIQNSGYYLDIAVPGGKALMLEVERQREKFQAAGHEALDLMIQNSSKGMNTGFKVFSNIDQFIEAGKLIDSMGKDIRETGESLVAQVQRLNVADFNTGVEKMINYAVQQALHIAPEGKRNSFIESGLTTAVQQCYSDTLGMVRDLCKIMNVYSDTLVRPMTKLRDQYIRAAGKIKELKETES